MTTKMMGTQIFMNDEPCGETTAHCDGAKALRTPRFREPRGPRLALMGGPTDKGSLLVRWW